MGWSRRTEYVPSVRTFLLIGALLLPETGLAASPDPLTATLLGALPAVEACRAAAIRRQEVAAGTLSVVIEPGDARAAVGPASSLTLSSALITCITDDLGTLHLPPDPSAYEAIWTLPPSGATQLTVSAVEDPGATPFEAIVDSPSPLRLDSTTPFIVDPAVDAAFRLALPAIRVCRDAAKRSGQRADGTVTTQLFVLADEPVIGPSHSTTVVDGALRCMNAALSVVSMPAGAEPAELRWFLPLSGPIELVFGRQKLVDVGPAYRATVDAVMRANAGSFATCYTTALAMNPALESLGATDIAVDADGKVIASRTRGDSPAPGNTGLPGPGQCLDSALAQSLLPEPDGEAAVVRYAFEQFRPVLMADDQRAALRGCLPGTEQAQLRSALYRRGGGPDGTPAVSGIGLGSDAHGVGPNVAACIQHVVESLPDPDALYYLVEPPTISAPEGPQHPAASP